jgi:hypothetical protein
LPGKFFFLIIEGDLGGCVEQGHVCLIIGEF